MADPVASQPVAPPGPAPAAPAIPWDIFCRKCGYNLRGLTADRCPECGRSLEGLRSPVSRIPWVHRKEIGRLRAYWKTVWFVMFRQAAFCEEMARPVSYRDSQTFRWMTILYAYIPLLVAGWYALDRSDAVWLLGRDALFGYVFKKICQLVIILAALPMFLTVATGMPGHFFHPRSLPVEVQGRAVTLSYYACAPLAISIIPAGLLLWAALGAPGWPDLLLLYALPGVALFGAQLYAWWTDLIRLARRTLPHFEARRIALAVALPILWLLAACLILVALPVVGAFIVLIVVVAVAT